MAKNYISINGREFELIESTEHIYWTSVVKAHRNTTIYDCYVNPSERKKAIYMDWMRWAVDGDVVNMGVHSYNSNIFTLTAMFTDDNGVDYALHITPVHNRAYKLMY